MKNTNYNLSLFIAIYHSSTIHQTIHQVADEHYNLKIKNVFSQHSQ
jgi:hypothetical protein